MDKVSYILTCGSGINKLQVETGRGNYHEFPVKNYLLARYNFCMVIKIWEIRTESGVTLKELSMKTGISVGALSNYENQKRTPNMEQMERIAIALNTKISNLYVSDYK